MKGDSRWICLTSKRPAPTFVLVIHRPVPVEPDAWRRACPCSMEALRSKTFGGASKLCSLPCPARESISEFYPIRFRTWATTTNLGIELRPKPFKAGVISKQLPFPVEGECPRRSNPVQGGCGLQCSFNLASVGSSLSGNT